MKISLRYLKWFWNYRWFCSNWLHVYGLFLYWNRPNIREQAIGTLSRCQDIPYVPASLGRVRRSILGGKWQPISLKFWLPEFLYMDSWNPKFEAKIRKIVDFLLMANFSLSILAGSKIRAKFHHLPPIGYCQFQSFTTCRPFTISINAQWCKVPEFRLPYLTVYKMIEIEHLHM